MAQFFWRERFGAGTFWRERFGAGTIWRERFGASVLAQIILVLFFSGDLARLFWDNAPWCYWVLAIWHEHFGAGATYVASTVAQVVLRRYYLTRLHIFLLFSDFCLDSK